jgi:general secretion pathway protein J
MRRVRRSQTGFTLAEMLVALTIFGILTAGSVALLSFSVRAQDMADRQLEAVASIRRTGALLSADLAQAAPRPWRDAAGQPQRAFVGAPAGAEQLMVLVRAGWDNPDQLSRSSLQRVEYRLANGRLQRTGYAYVDGAADPAISLLVDGVASLQLRYRDRDGTWRASWEPGDPAQLPVAVELTLATEGLEPLRQVFIVGNGR